MGTDDTEMAQMAQVMSHSQRTQKQYYDCRKRDDMAAKVSKAMRERLMVCELKIN